MNGPFPRKMIYDHIININYFKLADMVNLHFVNTLQALQQFNSAVLCQLYPMWEPVLTVHHAHVPRKLRLKFESVEAQACFSSEKFKKYFS